MKCDMDNAGWQRAHPWDSEVSFGQEMPDNVPLRCVELVCHSCGACRLWTLPVGQDARRWLQGYPACPACRVPWVGGNLLIIEVSDSSPIVEPAETKRGECNGK